jgi:hypothetical protein
MEPTNHARPSLTRSDAGRGSAAGGIALLVVFAAVLLAVSHPVLTLAVAAGAAGARLARRGVRAFRRRGRTVRTREAARADDVLASPAE